MSKQTVVKISINGKEFKVGCDKDYQSLLLETAKALDEGVKEMKVSNPHVSTEYLLLLRSLSLQEENLSLRKKNCCTIHEESMIETINQFSSYLETLAAKIKM